MQTRIGVMVILTVLSLVPAARAEPATLVSTGTGLQAPLPAGVLAPSVTLRAASGATIKFASQNGQTRLGVPPRVLDLPYLVLTHNGALTGPDERTLVVTVADLVVPPGGVTVTVTVDTVHHDPGQSGESGEKITVKQASKEISNPLDSTQRGKVAEFSFEFGETVATGTGPITTPTDYFFVQVAVLDAKPPASGPLHRVDLDPAFLMERRVVAPLPATVRASREAGPEALSIYYCDMFPFQKDAGDATTRLHREDVPAYVEGELLTAMVEAVRIQTEDWGFAWSDAWTSYREGKDEKRLSVALSDGKTWYHGPAPKDGNAFMTIRVSGGPNVSYETLTDGVMSTFHHELFHNLQRSIALELGGHGQVAGEDGAWEFFSEGTAVLASSVGQPAVQFAASHHPRAYLARAKRFASGSGFAGDLNSSYEDITPYHAAIYWRFLYEQCGGLEDVRTGMGLIRHVLEVLYAKKIVDIMPSTEGEDLVDGAGAADLVDRLPALMDAVLSSPEAAACPFQTYEDSLVHFSRALYGLRLDGGRCTTPGVPAGCGIYDPNEQYNAPRVSKLTYTGQKIVFGAEQQPYPAGIRSSYGMDMLEVVLHDKAEGQPLTLEFRDEPGGRAAFSVEIWKLVDDGTGTSWQPSLTAVGPAETLVREANGRLVYTIPEIDTGVYNRLGLVITRLDSQEDLDTFGTYMLELHPGQGGVER